MARHLTDRDQISCCDASDLYVGAYSSQVAEGGIEGPPDLESKAKKYPVFAISAP